MDISAGADTDEECGPRCHGRQSPKSCKKRGPTSCPTPGLRANRPGRSAMLRTMEDRLALVPFLDHAHDAGVVCRNPRSGHSRMHITLETDTSHTETCLGLARHCGHPTAVPARVRCDPPRAAGRRRFVVNHVGPSNSFCNSDG